MAAPNLSSNYPCKPQFYFSVTENITVSRMKKSFVANPSQFSISLFVSIVHHKNCWLGIVTDSSPDNRNFLGKVMISYGPSIFQDPLRMTFLGYRLKIYLLQYQLHQHQHH